MNQRTFAGGRTAPAASVGRGAPSTGPSAPVKSVSTYRDAVLARQPVEWVGRVGAPAEWIGPSRRRIVASVMIRRAVFARGIHRDHHCNG